MSKQEKPNIILIMTDQQRADTINALGADHMITPNMDRIVNNGVSFHQAFACGATCVASRAAMFTGMYAHNTGAYSFMRWAHHRSWIHELKDSGYHCVNIGKMHTSPKFDPNGFHERVIVENPTAPTASLGNPDDEWGRYLSLHGAERIGNRHTTDPDWRKKYQGVPWHLDEHLHTDVFIGNSATAWIRRHNPSKPVFLQIGFIGPHEPYDPLPRHLAMYENRNIPDPIMKAGELEAKPIQQEAHRDYFDRVMHECQIAMAEATPEDIARMRRHYYAKITTVDEKIGEILNDLDEKNYLDNALVIFTSDHGDLIGDHGLPYKWLMYDPIVRIPMILWDTRTDTHYTTEDLVSQIDIGPTILEAAGIAVPGYMEGKSLSGYMTKTPPAADPYVFSEDCYLTMVRSRKYKLVQYTYQEDQGELYDLEKDPQEVDNLFNNQDYRDIRRELKEALLSWLLRSNYRTASYKHTRYNSPQLLPQTNPYLQISTLLKPNEWYMRESTKVMD